MHKTWMFGAAGLLLAAGMLVQAVRGQQELIPPLPPPSAPVVPADVRGPALGPKVVPAVGSNKSDPVIVPIQGVEPRPAPLDKTTPPLERDGEPRTGRQEAAVSIEWVAPQAVRLNQPMSCQIVVRNSSGAAVNDVVVRHRLPQGVQLKSSEPQPISDAGDLSWSLGTVAGGQTRRIELQLVAQNKGALDCQASVSFTGSAAHQMVVREPLLNVKVKAPEKVVAGEQVTLLFTVNNPGDGPSEGVKLKAYLPEGIEHPRGRALEIDLGTLAAGEARHLQMVCVAKLSGPQKCMAVASGEGLSAKDAVQVDVLLPKLDLAMTGPKLRYLDRHATYVLKVSNPGNAPVAGVVLQEVVPAGFKFHSASGGGHFEDNAHQVSWAIGDLPAGQTREVTLDLIPTAPGDHKLAAQVSSARGLKTGAEVHTQVEGLASLIIELADADDPVEVGAETSYEIRITNTGTKTETNLELSCTLPEQMELRGAKCGAEGVKHRLDGRELTFEPVARLAPKADVIYRVQVRCKMPGDARLRARVRADDLRDPVLREESTRIYSDDAPFRTAPTRTGTDGQ